MSMSSRAADSYSGPQGITDIGINIEEIVERTDKVYNELDRKVHSSPAMMEDSEYLDLDFSEHQIYYSKRNIQRRLKSQGNSNTYPLENSERSTKYI